MGKILSIAMLLVGLLFLGCGEDSSESSSSGLAGTAGSGGEAAAGARAGEAGEGGEAGEVGEAGEMGTAATTEAVMAIFTPACGICHASTFPTLATIDTWAGLSSNQSDMPIIASGDHENSYLYHKLAGTHADAPANGSGLIMPMGGATLTVDELALVAAWIDAQ